MPHRIPALYTINDQVSKGLCRYLIEISVSFLHPCDYVSRAIGWALERIPATWICSTPMISDSPLGHSWRKATCQFRTRRRQIQFLCQPILSLRTCHVTLLLQAACLLWSSRFMQFFRSWVLWPLFRNLRRSFRRYPFGNPSHRAF